MKKLIFTGVIALGLGLMSFSSLENTEKIEDRRNGMCAELSKNVFKDTLNSTGDVDEAFEAQVDFYNLCSFIYTFHTTGF